MEAQMLKTSLSGTGDTDQLLPLKDHNGQCSDRCALIVRRNMFT